MKPILKYQKINGVECVIYLNKAGGMWFGVINGKPYGAHVGSAEDMKEQEKMLRTLAEETINAIKK